MGMKYVAFLRGINVGGNSLIKMAELKIAFEKSRCTNVITYINSGNVIFESDKQDVQLVKLLEKDLSQEFGMNLTVVVRSQKEMEEVIADAPKEWEKDDVRKYVSFIRDHVQMNEVVKEVDVREGVDSLKVGKHVLYMTTKMEGLTKSGFTKLVGKKIYKEMTMRNCNTVEKIMGIMERE